MNSLSVLSIYILNTKQLVCFRKILFFIWNSIPESFFVSFCWICWICGTASPDGLEVSNSSASKVALNCQSSRYCFLKTSVDMVLFSEEFLLLLSCNSLIDWENNCKWSCSLFYCKWSCSLFYCKWSCSLFYCNCLTWIIKSNVIFYIIETFLSYNSSGSPPFVVISINWMAFLKI